MADLTGTTPADTYKGLLQVNDYTDGVAGNTGSNALVIQDGAGNATALAVSTDSVGIGTESPTAKISTQVASGGSYFIDVKGTSNKQWGLKYTQASWLQSSFSIDEFNSSGTAYPRLTIADGGNVGVGTTSPTSKLEVVNSSNTEVTSKFYNGGGIAPATVHIIEDGASANHVGLFVGPNDLSSAVLITKHNNVGIGTTSPNEKLSVVNDAVSGYSQRIESTDTGADGLLIKTASGSVNKYALRIDGNNIQLLAVKSNGSVLPGTDGGQDFGSSFLRWEDIYATNTTIQSSDRELKQDIEELSEAETRVAQACKGLLRKYRWKSSVEEKGDEARIHFGIIAQDLEAAFAAEGLDAGRYGMFVKNTWWTADRVIPAVEAVEAVEAVYDEEGNIVSPAVEAVESQPEKTVTDIFNNSEDAPEGATEVTQRGVRYSELLAFIIAAI